MALLLPAVRGNTGYFDGDGKSVWLASTADVQMVSEAVEIEIHPGVAFFNCRFELRNLTDEPVTLQAGFPLSGFHYEGLGHDHVYPCDVPEPLIVGRTFGFVAREDDVTYHVRYLRHDRDQKYEHLFLWDMHFEPRQARNLYVSYHIGASGALGDTTRRDGPQAEDEPLPTPFSASALVHFYDYVTETGGSWAGRIEHAEFLLDISQGDEAIRAVLGTRVSMFGSLDFGRAEPDPLGPKHVWFAAGPPGWEVPDGSSESRPLQFAWRFAPFEPGAIFTATWVDTQLPTTVAGVRELARRYEASRGDHVQQLQALRAQLAAWYGVLPEDSVQRDFIENRVWFMPVSGRTEADLPDEVRAQLAAIDEMLASSAAPTTPAAPPAESSSDH